MNRIGQWLRPNTWLHTRPYTPMAKVEEFHNAVGQRRYWDIPMGVDGNETQAHYNLRWLRARLIMEEAIEAAQALGFNVDCEVDEEESFIGLNPIPGFVYDDLAEAHLLKELADVCVVTYGTGDQMSLPVEDGYDEVMRSNMSKFGDDGQPIRRADGKILKGPNYREADMNGVLTGNWL